MKIISWIFSCINKLKAEAANNYRPSYMNAELIDFCERLKQVVCWTEYLATGFDYTNGFYGTVFRETNPIINAKPLYNFDNNYSSRNFEGDYTTWNLDDYNPEIYHQLLEIAISTRTTIFEFDLSRLSSFGRILCFETCVTTHDGVPIFQSRCFVDESDVPPIDTWFYLKRNYQFVHQTNLILFCWIPRKFEKVMQDAIDVEMLGSYKWLDESDPRLYNQVVNCH